METASRSSQRKAQPSTVNYCLTRMQPSITTGLSLSASLFPYPGPSDICQYPLTSHQGLAPHHLCLLRPPDYVSLGVARRCSFILTIHSYPVAGAGETPQLATCLTCKPEDQNLVPRTHAEKGGMGYVARTCNPRTPKEGTGRSLGLNGQPAWSAWGVPSQ